MIVARSCVRAKRRLQTLLYSRTAPVYSAAIAAMAPPSYFHNLKPGRLEAFSDGVLAVIITIMVLELKVPHESGVAGLRAVLPILLIYALSFVFVGIYWVNHHLLVHPVEEVDARILYSNLLFLFSLSLLPFFTSWVLEQEHDSFSVILYSLSLVASGGAFMLLRLAIERRLRLSGLPLAMDDTVTRRKHWISLALYLVAIPVALAAPAIAMAIDALVTLVWILPDLGTREHRLNPRIQSRTQPLRPPTNPQDFSS